MMEDSCCIGLSLKQRCTDREGKIIKINIDDLSLAEMELLKVKSSIHEFDLVKEVCKKHKNQLLRDYSVNFKKCEDPFKNTKHQLKQTSMKSYEMNSNIPFIIIVFCLVKICVEGVLKSAMKVEENLI